MARTKMTAFSRLLLFLIIFLPLSFFGASYLNGEDPMEKLGEFFGGDGTTETAAATSNGNSSAVAKLENQILRLEKDLAVANEKLARCQLEQQQQQQ